MNAPPLADRVDRVRARRLRFCAALCASDAVAVGEVQGRDRGRRRTPGRRGMVAGLQRRDARRSRGSGRRRQSRRSPPRSRPTRPSRRALRRLWPGFFPHADAIGHVTANKQSSNRPLRSANQPTYYGDNLIGAQASYEIDIWGRVRDIAASANATAEATADALDQARLELHAELARDYVDLRGLDDEAKLLSDTIGIYRSALNLTKSRLAANIASPVDVDRAQAQLSSAEAQASDLALRRAALENAIAALVGKSAASFTSRVGRPLPLPTRPRAVPADVLRRRPDVAEAERLTAAADTASASPAPISFRGSR